ncbi:MAG TPA: magnesium transporter CorA family protein [Gaiellaceae bacterium]|nr:magnesium transporter CorA family protein [Gaiellaceae bacterium]
MTNASWIDLLDPTQDEIERALPHALHAHTLERLLAPAEHGDEPRPTLLGHGDYVFGVFLVAVAVPHEDTVFYQEVDLVLTGDAVVTVRKTPPGRPPFAPDLQGREPIASPALVAYRLVDAVAEAYLDLTDALEDEIDELEDNVDAWPGARVRGRISALRHDLLHIRQTLAPTRDAVRRVVDGRVDVDGDGIFDRDAQLHFADAYDKLLRAAEGIELARDLLGGVRDYHQSKVANDQNEVMKRLTVVASLLLLPTFIVGLYGQNFDDIPELGWSWGYGWSWAVIGVTTLLQLLYFRRKRWI